MPNKKKQRNSFYFFMKEKQEELAKQGLKFPMKEMSEYAHPLWKNLSLAEKEKYERMAKEHKIQYNAVGRRACDGTLILENMEQEERKEEIVREMRQGIVDFLRVPGRSKEEFIEANSQKKLYFVSFNILCYHKEENRFVPLEVGAAEYTIKDGLLKSYHKFIYPGTMPVGYTGASLRHSEDTHGIPISGYEKCERDYKKIWKELMDFINPRSNKSDVPPPVFCRQDDMFQTLGSLEWLAEKAGKSDEFQDVKVWDASYLLMELRAGAEQATVSYIIAGENLKKNNFDYIPYTRCDFHEEKDSAYCALGYAKRLCYLLSDAICGMFGIQATEKHLPLRASADKPYEVHIPNISKLSLHSTNERGIGRGLQVRNYQSSRPESSARDGMYSSFSDRADSRLHERTEPEQFTGISSGIDSRLQERREPTHSTGISSRAESSLQDRTEANHSTGISSIYSRGEPESSAGVSDSDSENSPAGSTVVNAARRLPTATAMSSTVELRQPSSVSIALRLARAGQAPAVVPGKGIGRGQRKLP